ncbi:putative taste receptor type 2 member 33 [Pongo abelii]|uniref:putative taste receptor type 2 member 33 n=1 Tax=Pongo abelii TaxID=9601 RepID=UPI0023E8CB2D|nr:putative taste receptor type 2 member 33 [Pongo abelii]
MCEEKYFDTTNFWNIREELVERKKLARRGSLRLYSQLLWRLRQENGVNPGGKICSEPRSCHCTPAWAKEQDSVSKKEKKIGLFWVILLYLYATVFNSPLYSLEVRIVASNVLATINHFSIWLATSLSIFYLLKIANFSNLIFLHLKKRIKNVALVILLGSLVFLICNLSMVTMDDSVWTKEYEGNVTWKIKLRNAIHLSNLTASTLANLVSFTLTLISFLLLICSPCKHLKKMQLHGKGSQDLSTKVHIEPLQTETSFLMLFAIYFLC